MKTKTKAKTGRRKGTKSTTSVTRKRTPFNRKTAYTVDDHIPMPGSTKFPFDKLTSDNLSFRAPLRDLVEVRREFKRRVKSDLAGTTLVVKRGKRGIRVWLRR